MDQWDVFSQMHMLNDIMIWIFRCNVNENHDVDVGYHGQVSFPWSVHISSPIFVILKQTPPPRILCKKMWTYSHEMARRWDTCSKSKMDPNIDTNSHTQTPPPMFAMSTQPFRFQEVLLWPRSFEAGRFSLKDQPPKLEPVAFPEIGWFGWQATLEKAAMDGAQGNKFRNLASEVRH